MALKTCPECGKEVSSYSEACVHCGYRERQPQRNKLIVIALVLQIIVICVLTLAPVVYEFSSVYVKERYDYFGRPYEDKHRIGSEGYSIFLQCDNTESVQSVAFLGYMTVMTMCITAVTIFAVKSNARTNRLNLAMPMLSAALLAIHGILVSNSQYEMKEYNVNEYVRCYFEAYPSIWWVVLIGIEIAVFVLLKNAITQKSQSNSEENRKINDIETGYIDMHGNYYGPEMVEGEE